MLFAGLCLMAAMTQEASAFPVFARKYQTSCQTCHAAFPKLNTFGEAFRQNGYRFPGDDASAVKDDPVSLGSEAYKKVWPDAIWPGTLPHLPPISVVTHTDAGFSPRNARRNINGVNDPTKPAANFNNFNAEFEILSAGTFDENISYLTVVSLSNIDFGAQDGGVELERGFVSFHDVLCYLHIGLNGNLRVGAFDPTVFSFSTHRRLLEAEGYSILNGTDTAITNNWSLEAAQKGFELNGVAEEGQCKYNLGLVEGNGGVVNNHKDWYGHLAYKLGGTRFDGQGATSGEKPWRDDAAPMGYGLDSLQFGAMYYSGIQEFANAAGGEDQQDKFTKRGADINAYMGDLNIIVAAARTKYAKPLANSTDNFIRKEWMAEGDYVYKPWLVPMLRFESTKLTRQGVPGYQSLTKKFIPGVNFLVRPNCKVEASAEVVGGMDGRAGPDSNKSYSVEAVNLVLKFGF